MRIRSLLAEFFLMRWLGVISALIRGARLHPSAVVIGSARQIHLGSRSAIGPRCRLDAGSRGKIELGTGCWLSADVDLQTDTSVQIGSGTTVQRRTSILGTTRVGRGCIIAPNVFISSGTHPFREYPALPIRQQEALVASNEIRAAQLDRAVWVQDDCWLATNVVICPGVVIGKGSIVGANAVVLEDVAPYSVVAGVPAKVVGRRLDWQPPTALEAAEVSHDPYILSGVISRRDAGRAAAYQVSRDEPLQAAIGPAAVIFMEYVASDPLRVLIGSKEFAIGGGGGVLNAPLETSTRRSTYSVVDVQILSATPQAALRISKLGAAETA